MLLESRSRLSRKVSSIIQADKQGAPDAVVLRRDKNMDIVAAKYGGML